MFRKFVLPGLAVVGVVFAVYTVVTGSRTVPASAPVAPPSQAPFASYVAGAGLVEASTENIAIGTPVGGLVTDVHAKVGDAVRRGDPLFHIDTRDLEADLLVRRAEVETAKANVEAADAHLADATNQYRLYEASDPRAVSKDELSRRKFAVDVRAAEVAQAKAQVAAAEAQVQQVRTEIERRTVRAPVDGRVMQVKVRAGEFAPAGTMQTPLMLVGNVDRLHVRVDVDENDAWRVADTAKARAFVRGNPRLTTELSFVRIEPYVVPKRSLTGESTERVDTRVLQVVYAFDGMALPVYVGQQMDVFVEDAAAPAPATAPVALR
jgi:RND family efflux transporter MFP subunit